MENLKKLRNYSFAISIVYIILGLLMILNPSFISNAINYVIGFLIMLYGVVYLINLHKNYLKIFLFFLMYYYLIDCLNLFDYYFEIYPKFLLFSGNHNNF